jgi:hypothetical protein
MFEQSAFGGALVAEEAGERVNQLVTADDRLL